MDEVGWFDKDSLDRKLCDHNFHKDITVENTSIEYINGLHGYNNGDGDHFWMIWEFLSGAKFKLLIG